MDREHYTKRSHKFPIEELTREAKAALKERGVTLQDIAKIVYQLQSAYVEELELETCMYHVTKVLEKREVVHAILTGIAIDKMVEEDRFPEPINTIIKHDEGLFGIDEILPLSIINLYGSIGLTNFGYLDKEKIGIIRELDRTKDNTVNTFLDDLIAAVAAAAASRLAHSV
ncbi:MAG: phosphatidylglycerophosphatase A [Tissierellia bacterium]|nr:phosphatidylglycerophosphatase A [Tissierellia bacterium]